MKRLFVLVVLLGILGMTTWAQMGPETGMLAKSLFGIDGLAVLEVALPSEVSYNPAAVPLALELFDEKSYVELDYGSLDFKAGPEVVNTWQLCAFRAKKLGLRLARYSIESDPAPTKFAGPDYQVEFKGETYEAAAGLSLTDQLAVGVAWVPYERIVTNIFADGDLLATFEAKTTSQLRYGAVFAPSKALSFGLVSSRGNASNRMTIPALSSRPASVEDYKENLTTLGVGYQPIEGTILSAAWQKGSLEGNGLDANIDLATYGLKQYLNPDFSVNVSLNDRTWGYGLTYAKGGTTLGMSYAPDTYRSAEDYLGRCRTWYFWFGKSW